MNTRCKPGQYAYVVDSLKQSQIGVPVKIERLSYLSFDGAAVWEISFSGVVVGIYNEVLVGNALCRDDCLRPISGLPLDEEIHDELTV